MLIALLLVASSMTDTLAGQPVQDLSSIYTTYQTVARQPSVSGYVGLDKRLRAFIASREELYSYMTLAGPRDTSSAERYAQRAREDGQLMKPEYSDLGLYLDQNDEILHYNGQMVDLAHVLDSNSAFREYTLFAEVERGGALAVDQIATALRYAREFPNGSFVGEVYTRIAGHFADAYVISRDSTAGWIACLEFYEGLVDTAARVQRMPTFREKAIEFYRKALKINPHNRAATYFFDRFLRDDNTNMILYCSEC